MDAYFIHMFLCKNEFLFYTNCVLHEWVTLKKKKNSFHFGWLAIEIFFFLATSQCLWQNLAFGSAKLEISLRQNLSSKKNDSQRVDLIIWSHRTLKCWQLHDNYEKNWSELSTENLWKLPFQTVKLLKKNNWYIRWGFQFFYFHIIFESVYIWCETFPSFTIIFYFHMKKKN